MTKFSDLDAMDDADWDKVTEHRNTLLLASRRLTMIDSAGQLMSRATFTFSRLLCPLSTPILMAVSLS
jgi:hypothetical protein